MQDTERKQTKHNRKTESNVPKVGAQPNVKINVFYFVKMGQNT
jgi:hypothetical protein